MDKIRVLYVCQEISPYVPENQMSKLTRELTQGTLEIGKEIRTFMPRFGCVNERRHQLHEVIRLSGLNLVISDINYPLFIKVASIQVIRMQIYFIENEDFFKRKAIFENVKTKEAFEDNDERCIFFTKAVLESTKKLNWSPNIIHCHGWMTALFPAYIRNVYKKNPIFSQAKIFYSPYNQIPTKGNIRPEIIKKLHTDGIPKNKLKTIKDPTYTNLHKFAIENSDGLILQENMGCELSQFSKKSKTPFIIHKKDNENYIEKYNHFYDKILNKNAVIS